MVVAALGLAACGGGKHEETGPIKQAREAVARGDCTAAQPNIDAALAKHADDVGARGLALFCLDHAEGIDKLAHGRNVLSLHAMIRALGTPAYDVKDNTVADVLTDVRTQLAAKRITVKDNADLDAVIVAAATAGFPGETDPGKKGAYAAIAAGAGDAQALSFLVDELGKPQPDQVVGELALVGTPAIGALEKAVANPSLPGRKSAIDALVRLRAAAAATALVGSDTALHAPRGALGLDDVGPSYLDDPSLPVQLRAHVRYVVPNPGADGILVVQTANAQRVKVALFTVHEGIVTPIKIEQDGKPYDLGGDSAVYGVRFADKGGVKVRRVAGGKQQIVNGTLDKDVLTIAAGAAASKNLSPEDAMAAFADRACDCPDAACATTVSDEFADFMRANKQFIMSESANADGQRLFQCLTTKGADLTKLYQAAQEISQ